MSGTQLFPTKTPYDFPILFDGSMVSLLNAIYIIGFIMSSYLFWKPHITQCLVYIFMMAKKVLLLHCTLFT